MTPINQRWVITGANGYLGGELCKSIHLRGGTVLGVARTGRNLSHLEEMGITCCGYEDMLSILSDKDVLVHCAGMVGNSGSWDEFVGVNRDWSATLFNQASNSGVSCFVYVSSVAALGYRNRSGKEIIDESFAPDHVDGEIYGRSKWLAEQALLEYAKESLTRMVVLRPGLIYGRKRLAHSQTWLRRGFVVDPSQRVPLLHIDNFVEAVVKVVMNLDAHGVFMVVDEEQPKLSDLNVLKTRYGILRFTPWRIGKAGYWLLWFIRATTRKLLGRTDGISFTYALAEYVFHTRRILYNTQKLRSQVGWMPAVSLEDALNEYDVLQA